MGLGRGGAFRPGQARPMIIMAGSPSTQAASHPVSCLSANDALRATSSNRGRNSGLVRTTSAMSSRIRKEKREPSTVLSSFGTPEKPGPAISQADRPRRANMKTKRMHRSFGETGYYTVKEAYRTLFIDGPNTQSQLGSGPNNGQCAMCQILLRAMCRAAGTVVLFQAPLSKAGTKYVQHERQRDMHALCRLASLPRLPALPATSKRLITRLFPC